MSSKPPSHRGGRRRRTHSPTVIDDADRREAVLRARGARGRSRRRRWRRVLLRKRVLGGVLIVLLVCAAAYLASDAISLRLNSPGDYEQALARFERGEYRDSILALQRVLRSQPDKLAARVLIGRAYLQVGYAPEAESELARAYASGADAALVVRPLAAALLEQGKYDELFDTLRVGGEDPVQRKLVLSVRGDAQLRLGELAAAEASYRDALQLDAGLLHAQAGLARVALRRLDLDAAETHLAVLRDGHPQATETLLLEAELGMARQQFDVAEQHLDRLIEQQGTYTEALLLRAGLRLRGERLEAASADLQTALTLRPDWPMALFTQALKFSQAGADEQAARSLERARSALVRLHPQQLRRHAPAQLVLGISAYRGGDLEQAQILLSRYLDLRPLDLEVRKLLAALLLARAQVNAAVAVLEPALRLNDSDPHTLLLLRRARLALGDEGGARALLGRLDVSPEHRAQLRMALAFGRLVDASGRIAADGLESAIDTAPGPLQAAALLVILQLREGNLYDALYAAREQVQRHPQQAAAHNLLGVVWREIGERESARRSFEEALSADPEYWLAAHSLAALDHGDGRLQRAAERWQAILDRRPDDQQAMLGLARSARDGGDEDGALAWYARLREAGTARPEVLLETIDLYLLGGHLDEAAELSAELSARLPDSPAARVARGRVALARGESATANRGLGALVRDETSPGRLYEMARLQLAADDTDGARDSLERALAIDAQLVPARLALAELDLRVGHLEAALEGARALLEGRPGLDRAQRIMGEALLALGRPGEALDALERAFEQRADSALAVRLFETRRATGDLDRALAGLEAWVAEHADDTLARRTLARGYLLSGRFDEAREAHEQLLAVAPRDVELLRGLSQIYVRAADPRALGLAEEAHALAPDDPLNLDALGWALVASGDPDRALPYLREAQSRAAADPLIGYHIAVALAQLGREEEARRELHSVLASDDAFAEASAARRLLARLDTN